MYRPVHRHPPHPWLSLRESWRGAPERDRCTDSTHKPAFLALSIDAHQALGSPSGRAGAKRLRGLTAPILPINYPQNHRTDSSHELHSAPHCLHIPLPLPSGGTSPGGRGKAFVQTSNSITNRNVSLRPPTPTASLVLPPGELAQSA